MMHKNIAH